MKSFDEIIKQDPVFMNDWNHKIDVIGDFEDIYLTRKEYEATESPYRNESYWLEKKAKMKDTIERYKAINMLFASYGCANYSGDAWVLFEQDGKLYEVNGGHCSCYGLEGQWEPEEVELNELQNRLVKGTFGEDDYAENVFKEKLCEFLGIEFKRNRNQNY